jgi:hypothetical protein
MKYPYIAAWGARLGSFKYYIVDQIAEATKDNAPERATYKGEDGRWHTIDEAHEATRASCEAWVQNHNKK